MSSNRKVPKSAHIELKSEWQTIMTDRQTNKQSRLLTCIRCQTPASLRKYREAKQKHDPQNIWQAGWIITGHGFGSLLECGEARSACLCPVSKPYYNCNAHIGLQPIQQALRLCAATCNPMQLAGMPLWMLLAAFALACAILRAPPCLPDRGSTLNI